MRSLRSGLYFSAATFAITAVLTATPANAAITGDLYFAGCSAGTASPAPQDTEWTRILINTTAQVFPAGAGLPFVFGPTGTQVKSISIIHDEGTNNVGSVPGNDTESVGLAVIDNINIGGKFIMSGRGIEPESDGNGHHH